MYRPSDKRTADYLNIPRPIGMVVGARLATLHELDTVYGPQDLWQMIEVLQVDNYNASLPPPKG